MPPMACVTMRTVALESLRIHRPAVRDSVTDKIRIRKRNITCFRGSKAPGKDIDARDATVCPTVRLHSILMPAP